MSFDNIITVENLGKKYRIGHQQAGLGTAAIPYTALRDVLTALLANSWVAPCALLFRREIVQRCGGWDESLEAAQDRDSWFPLPWRAPAFYTSPAVIRYTDAMAM